MTLYTESIEDQTDHFANVLFAKELHTAKTCDNVMTLECLHLMPFCLEKSSVRKGIFLMF